MNSIDILAIIAALFAALFVVAFVIGMVAAWRFRREEKMERERALRNLERKRRMANGDGWA